ncbi:hypothetical protein RF11_13091 [Thelohanellus kitauei]|uniref:Uncharacterized protein n=1 Tax=Thelohanellus kitauei TaxID=669202 RepID=A0A0C2IU92_THEKT|nr:hypothetical protein RF11_13091 [Thelohanellus kitauei]
MAIPVKYHSDQKTHLDHDNLFLARFVCIRNDSGKHSTETTLRRAEVPTHLSLSTDTKAACVDPKIPEPVVKQPNDIQRRRKLCRCCEGRVVGRIALLNARETS